MSITYGKKLNYNEEQLVREIAFNCGVQFDTARLMFYRGIDSIDRAKRFLNPGKKYFNNPFDLQDMQEAVDRITYAKNHGENVLIFGDYDADGVCATTILYNCLKDFGIVPNLFIPERDLGYGLNVEKVLELAKIYQVNLVITVDCGISDYEKIEKIKQAGIDVIVTDHHEPPEVLPDCIKINPKISGQKYPFRELCGAGVAYKLGYALNGKSADEYLDFVALATVADSMDLADENRDLVVEGLKIFNSQSLRLQFSYLIGEFDKKITAQTLAYSIAPRVNAGGRMGDVVSVLKFFISENPNDIFDLAVKLNKYNLDRQTECDRIFNEAKLKIYNENLDKDSVILVEDKDWKSGFIGIVAAKLVEIFNRPVIVFTEQDGHLKGSARSVDGVNIYNAISSAKDILIGFGGHSQAAGVSVEINKLNIFRKYLCEFVEENFGKTFSRAEINCEWEITEKVSMQFAKEISLLGPFGMGNRVPFFSTTLGKVEARPIKVGSPHISFVSSGLEMLMFNGENSVQTLSLPVDKKIIFELNLSTFRGKDSLKGFVKSIIPDYGDFSKINYHVFRNEILKLRNDSTAIFMGDWGQDCQDKIVKTNSKNIEITEGFGTLYVLSDAKNFGKYNFPDGFSTGLFSSPCTCSQNCLIVSPDYIPEGYERVIYLDKPLCVLDFGGQIVVVDDVVGFTMAQSVSTERADWENIFRDIISLCNKKYNGAISTAFSVESACNESTIICALETFFELGFIKIENGELVRDFKVKNALTNSGIYSKIYSLKGELC